MPRARFRSIALLATLVAASQTGCGGGGGGPGPVSPAALSYAVNPAVYTRGVAVAPNLPQRLGGAPASYTIAPDLPTGLTFDAATGAVAGTPAVTSPLTAYTVTGVNAGGSVTCSLLIAVNEVPPAALSYPDSALTYTRGVAIHPETPKVTGGGPVTRFTTSPALPAGLTLDPKSGVIAGTPTEVVALGSWFITAINSGGSASFKLTMAVKDVAPSGLVYPKNPAVYVSGSSIAPNRPTVGGGAVVSFQIVPELPQGLFFDTGTGEITGAPAAASVGQVYTVTATNSGGSTTCTLTITVNAPPPVNLTYGDPAPVYTRGQAIAANTPSSSGGKVVTYTVSPALPAGLALDSVSGIISGTPSAVSAPAAYTFTATNSGGSASCTVTIAVREASPTALVYATNPTEYTVGTAIQPNVPGNGGGIISSYSVSPALPAGLSLDPHTGVISGTPTAVTPSATYVITGANATGSTTCNFVTAVGALFIPPPTAPSVTAATYAASGQTGLQASTADQGTANGMTYAWNVTNGSITSGQGTPVITYTAGAPGSLTLDVKVSNLGGSAQGSRGVTVVGVPRAELFAQQEVLAGTPARASVAAQPNMTYAWTLGAGTIVSGTGNVLDYTAGLAPGAYQLSVTVLSPLGASATVSRSLQILAGAFLPDARSSRQREGHTVTLLLDGRVLVAGGDDFRAAGVPGADLYDPWSNTWTRTGPMTAFRSSHAAALLSDGRVLVSGGYDPAGGMLATSELYDPATNAWTSAGQMNATRQNHTATLLTDGTVLIAGGFGLDNGGTTGGYLSSAEIFDPASHAWIPVTPLSSARTQHTATRLQNGLVLVAGGAKASTTAGFLNTAELYDPAQQTWTSVGNLNRSRLDHTAALLPGGKVLVAGGHNDGSSLDDGEVFNPATSTWTAAANRMTTAHSNHAMALTAGGKVLVIGGSSDATGAQVESYDPAINRWSRVKDLLAGRIYAAGVSLPTGQILVVGGRGVQADSLASPELYDVAADIWSTGGSWSSSRFGHTATNLADGTVLVVGGSGDATNYLKPAERFDPTIRTWTSASSLNQGRSNHTASLLADGRVLVVGGFGAGSVNLGSAEIYTPAGNAWTSTGSLTMARNSHTATVLQNGKVLVVGGSAGAASLASAELYDPATGLWSSAGTMATARAGHTASLLPSGKVLVAGGGGSNSVTGAAELYDPASNSWSPAAPMISLRKNHTATSLANGSVLVIGGQADPSSGLRTVELYDPVANSWSPLASISSQRFSHAATLLPDGRVLVTGGRLGSNTPNATADLYDPVAQTTTALPMVSARAYHTATLLDAAGTVLILGGSPGSTPEYWRP